MIRKRRKLRLIKKAKDDKKTVKEIEIDLGDYDIVSQGKDLQHLKKKNGRGST